MQERLHGVEFTDTPGLGCFLGAILLCWYSLAIVGDGQIWVVLYYWSWKSTRRRGSVSQYD